MLESLTHDLFADRIGETFRLEAEAPPLLFELIAVEPRAGGGPGNGRRAFSLLFRGPPEPLLEQRVRALQHDAFGTLEIFLVPIGRDERGVRYEASFN